MTLPIELDPEEKGNSMSDPSDIPQDVMRAAQAVVNASHQPGAEKALLVARAIMAERAACAERYRVGAESHAWDYFEEAEDAINPKR